MMLGGLMENSQPCRMRIRLAICASLQFDVALLAGTAYLCLVFVLTIDSNVAELC